MKVKSKAAYFLVFMLFTSCAHYSTTQKNIKKVNADFEIKKNKDTLQTPVPVQTTIPDHTGAMPLAQFLDAKTPTELQSINPWFSRLQEWSRIYIEIAKSERDVRNYKLSSKYSGLATMWADRALQIKDLTTDDAVIKVRSWIEELKWPSLPETSSYYAAQDVYAKIFITRNILNEFQNRFCLVSHGISIVSTLASLDLSIDLYRQKKYAKALYKIQNGLTIVENVKPDEDKNCDLTEDDESEEAK